MADDKCGSASCDRPAVFAFDWPGHATQLACLVCAMRAETVALAMGFPLAVRFADPELERVTREHALEHDS